MCNKTRDLLTRIDWKFYVLERLWSWHVLVIDNDYDHGICWRSIVSMIMTCVGDQEWLWSWHVLAIKLIRTDDWLLRHQNRWLITEAPKTDDWLLRWPLLVYGGTEGSKEQIANSNGVDRCFKRMVIWQSFLALFNCWWIHPWSDVDIDARIFKTLCQKLTCDVQKETS